MSSEFEFYTNSSEEYNYTWLESYYNVSNNETFENGNQFILPWWKQIIWTCLYAGMVVVGTGGNLIVIWDVLVHKSMRRVTNYFLVNLSIADTMVLTLNVTFNYVYMMKSDWTFGLLFCKINQFVAVLSTCASAFTLMAISIDRYMAIVHPLRPRMGRRTTLCIVAAIWIVSYAISFPMLIVFTTYIQEFPNGDQRVICYSKWPDGPTNESYQEYLYNVFFTILTYLLPICSMIFTYIRVGLKLWRSRSIGECTQGQLENIKSKRRVVKKMLVVVLIFSVCWSPFHIYFIVTSHVPEITNFSFIQEEYLGIYWLAMSCSMFNPITYCWMNHWFRREFKQFLSCCPFVHITPDELTRREAVISRHNSCSGSPETHFRIARHGTVHMPVQTGSLGIGMSTLGDTPYYFQYSQESYRGRKRWRQNDNRRATRVQTSI